MDLTGAPILKDVLTQTLENPVHANPVVSRMILDLRRVTFVDSTGIYTLVATKRRCSRSGTQLGLRMGDSPIARILMLAGVTEFLETE